MRIKTRFFVSMGLFGVVLVVVAAATLGTNRQVERYDRQEEIAKNVDRTTGELIYLSNEYLLYREERLRKRWESKWTALGSELARLEPGDPKEKAIVESIRAGHRRLWEVFETVSPTTTFELLSKASWSRMAVENQSIASDALQLTRVIDDHRNRLNRAFRQLVALLLGVFGASLIVTYWIVQRRLFASIEDLQAGAEKVGAGNLDFVVGVGRDDEIGDLARAFNRMTADLKSITASKEALDQEIAVRKRAEEALAAANASYAATNAELQAFVYSISHDLRGPARSVSAFVQMLLARKQDLLDAQGRHFLDRIAHGAEKMKRLIEDLLALSGVSRQAITPADVDLSALAASIVAELREQDPSRDVTVEISPGLRARADAGLMEIVLSNLLGNAWKFTSQSVKARIRLGSLEQEGRTVCFVEDDGVGFDETYAASMFEPFHRLHGEHQFEGTGIGLAIVERAVRRHGGRVWARGEAGKGATFFFTLPDQGTS